MSARQGNMTASQIDGQDWWKIQPQYSNKVLIGNWLGDRQRFARDTWKLHSSMYRTDFICFPYHKPDQKLRRIMMEKYEGLPLQHLFTHHEEPRSRHLVSEYEDKYNRHSYNPILPPFRSWNVHKLAWTPERSDFPILEPPTNYGLLEYLKKKWHPKEAGVMSSVYTISYESPPISAFTTCQLRQPAKIYNCPFNHGHLPQRILDLEWVRNSCSHWPADETWESKGCLCVNCLG